MSSFQYPPKPQNDNQLPEIIKIFLASSSELKEDREQFEIFINRKNKEYIKKGIFLELVLWEDFIDSMSRTRLQDEYNKAITDCDIFVSLFFTKVGKYTEEEFLKAWETFKVNDNPLIFTYFKNADIKTSDIKKDNILSLLDFKEKLSEKGHYSTNYENIDNLKNHFSDQLIKLLPKLKEKKIYLKEKKNNSFIGRLMSSDERSEVEEITNLLLSLSSVIAQINPETIQRADQNSLPPDAELWNLQSNDIAAILNKLNEFRRLTDFVEQLNQDNNISEEVRDKLKHYAEKLPQKKPQEDKIDKPPNDLNQQLESFILFTLNSTENKDQFLLNAWLIKDNSVEDIVKFQSLLSSDEKKQGTSCKLSEIPAKTCKFIKKGLKELRGTRYCLIVEFFLPSDLMLTDVDQWKMLVAGIESITLGTKYPVRLRSRERLNLDYLDFNYNQWCDRWDEVNAVLEDESALVDFEHLPAMENFNGQLLQKNLMNKIGLKVTCPPPKTKIEELFRAILIAATPIAIWTRRDLPNCNCLSEIDEFLSGKLLCNLCESVRKLREEADANTEEHFGSHLAILWEDPYRLTPDVMVELKVIGQ